ncbi:MULTISPECIES: hypothetical protein [unclassified Streptomyces]|jgi:hypothetical protein|uniref:hypothetical protein n=1 Tax=unclassified Streptomyces TaxID=2593676 RepID=UPI002E37BB20|nr:hypothetical protein [Streptomyces sp. NBC_01431]
MSLQDELTAAQRCLDDLVRAVGRLEGQVESGLDIRRVRTDADHLRESLALLREAAPPGTATARPDLVTISDTPYDTSLWTDADDEGLGSARTRGRRAP